MAKDDGKPQPVGEMQGDGNWTKTVWIPQISDSHRIGVQRIRQELDLEKRAATDGQRNLPAQSDATLNEPQMEICGKVFAGILMLNQFLSDQVGLAVKQARQLISRDLDVDRTNDRVSAEIDRVFGEHRAHLVELKLSDLSKHRDLRYFRTVNALSRGAHYKDSMALVFGILIAVFFAESVLNGSLLSAIMETGLLGGAALAGMISFINIASGVVAGLWGWRFISHKRVPLRVLGVTVTVVCHSVAMLWNLFVAHFREVAETAAASGTLDFDMAKLGTDTLAHMDAHGLLGMGSVPSWALLLFGVLIHFLSAKEGWDDIADRYPDYRKYDKRAVDARATFDDALADLRDEARAAVESIETEVNVAASRAAENHQVASSMLELAYQRQQEVKDSEDEWVAGGSLLLKTYRDINREVRDEGSAPAYFSIYPTAEDYRRRSFGGGIARSDEVEERSHSIDRAMQELGGFRDAARKAAEEADEIVKAIHRHITLTVRKLDKRIEEEVQAVTRVAKQRLEEDFQGESGRDHDIGDEALGDAAA